MAKKTTTPATTELAVVQPATTALEPGELGGQALISPAARAFLEGAKGAKEAPPRMPVVGIDHKSGTFVLPSGEVAESIGGYLIYFFQTRAWFKDAYQAGQKAVPPDCWSADLEEPHRSSRSPQSQTCASCARNQFGSARNDRGKACATKTWLFIVNKRFGNPPIGVIIAPPSNIKTIFGSPLKAGYLAKAKALAGAYQIVHTTIRLRRENPADPHCMLDFIPGAVLQEEEHIMRLLEIHNTFRDAMECMREEEGAEKEEVVAAEEGAA